MGLVFGRRVQGGRKRPTPGRFRTRVITEGVTPSLHIDYKNSKIKQYHKLGKALRTETTINDTADFGVAKGLSHLPELKEITGIRQARFLTRLTQRLLIPGLSQLTDPTPPVPTRLRAADRAYDAAIDQLTHHALLAA